MQQVTQLELRELAVQGIVERWVFVLGDDGGADEWSRVREMVRFEADTRDGVPARRSPERALSIGAFPQFELLFELLI
jgi:hypothetical protein